MAAINDLIERISDPELRRRISDEVARMQQQKKFGLVFEEHLPEATPLYDVPIKKESLVAEKDGFFKKFYRVKRIEEDKLVCETQDDKHEEVCFEKEKMVAVAMFGEPIYPYLKPIDEVQNASESKLWHTLIEAENYHALQLLVYLYGGKVDCIYIDPPYNTGDKSWKYNNDYVDGSDSYRHSKWLSMMKKRLALAKKLLNPNDSVLIVTIDEREYLRLGCLLEDLFPDARIQMVATQITPQGNPRVKQFYRTEEYIFFVGVGQAQPAPLPLDQYWRTGVGDSPIKNINWASLLRTGTARKRKDRQMMFYPFFIKNTEDGPVIDSIGEAFFGNDLNMVDKPDGTIAVWPIGSDGELRRWQVSPSSARKLQKQGFLRLGKWNWENTAVQYLAETNRLNIQNGTIPIKGKRYDGSIMVNDDYIPSFVPGSLWKIPSHDATRFGSQLLLKVLGQKRFDFPKSLYAVHDTIRFFVANKPNALIVDFFAGSGTTLQAVNLLNKEDGGNRRCIMVTNNEVSAEEEKRLRAQGYHPGDDEWERLGIARYVNWPRTVCSIEGHDIDGQPLKGNYLGCDIPMSEGFATNAQFFKLGFLDKNSVALARQFHELLPLLWMKSGGIGKCPELSGNSVPDMLILPENQMAILNNEDMFSYFRSQMNDREEIRNIFFVTNSSHAFREMASSFTWADSYQLYKDYLENFTINYSK